MDGTRLHSTSTVTFSTLPRAMLTRRTQESLDKGVREMSEIYKSYDKVGIKDRSMIWNS